MAHIVIIDYDHGAKLGRWQVNLTDGARVWDRARFSDPRLALGQLEHRQRAGHAVISEAARADLATAAFYRMLVTAEQHAARMKPMIRYTANYVLDLVRQHGWPLPPEAFEEAGHQHAGHDPPLAMAAD